jgi:hypothetical protein
MKKLTFILFTFMAFATFAQQETTDSITANGQKLLKLLDASKVEELWQKGF